MSTLAAKKATLTSLLKDLKKVTVAFSGGIDSTLVLKMALNVLGQGNVTAVVANSELFTDEEFDKAVSLAEEMGANVQSTTLDYLSDDHIKENTPDSWYYAKKMLYTPLKEIAAANGSNAVSHGMLKHAVIVIDYLTQAGVPSIGSGAFLHSSVDHCFRALPAILAVFLAVVLATGR